MYIPVLLSPYRLLLHYLVSVLSFVLHQWDGLSFQFLIFIQLSVYHLLVSRLLQWSWMYLRTGTSSAILLMQHISAGSQSI